MTLVLMLKTVFVLILVGVSFLHAESVDSVELTVAPTNPLGPSAPVILTWRGLRQPSAQDWVGIYSPSNSSDSDWIGFFNLTRNPDWQTGNGNLNVTLRDLRSDYQFRLFKASSDALPPQHPDVVLPTPAGPPIATSAVVTLSDGGRPQQVHLAMTSSVSEMRVMWTSSAVWPGSEVQYGRSSESLGERGAAQWATYTRSQMCEAPANTLQGWRDPGFTYDAVMTGLSQGAKYYYRVGSVAGGWSDVLSFHTQPQHASETYALVFGDMGVAAPYESYLRLQPESAATLQRLQNDVDAVGDRPLVVSHIGDISYARGRAWLWDEFMAAIEPIASRVPYHVAVGNHEYNWPDQPWNPEWASYGHDSGGECGVPYSVRFHMPGNASVPTGTAAPPTRNVWYSVGFGTVHFTYISTEHNFLPGSPQYVWLEADLAGVDRARTPFVIVSGHRPMYTSNDETRDAGKREQLVAHVEPLLVRYQVSLCLWGHVHKFERTCPLHNFTCHQVQPGTVPPPIHAVIGMGGQDWQPPWAPLYGYIYPAPAWSVFRQDSYGYCRLQSNRDTLTLTYVTNRDGKAHDYVEILSPAAYRTGVADPIVPLWGATAQSSRLSWRVFVFGITSLGLSGSIFAVWVALWIIQLRRQQKSSGLRIEKGPWNRISGQEEALP